MHIASAAKMVLLSLSNVEPASLESSPYTKTHIFITVEIALEMPNSRPQPHPYFGCAENTLPGQETCPGQPIQP